jgi:hypothetical protein
MNGIVRRIAETAPDVIVIDLENPNRDQLEHVLQMTGSSIARSRCSSTARIPG